VNRVAAVSARSTPAPIALAADPAGLACPADAPDAVTAPSVTVAFLQDARDRRG
jgi:hypothetical protein